MRNDTWEIMSIIKNFNNRVKNMKTYSKEYEDMEKLYAQAIRLQCKRTYGYIMTVDDFIEDVASGSYMDYDGIGEFMTYSGEEGETIRCNCSWLEKNRKDYSFVFWCNK